jgi:hypothetical protein
MARINVRIQHTSMQFSDSVLQHQRDAKKIFDRAQDKDVWLMSGTEAGGGKKNHDLRDALIKEAGEHGFYINASTLGEWVALNKKFLGSFAKGYAGPFIKGTTGVGVAGGAHAPRGVAWASGTAKEHRLGRITIGSAHYLTKRSMAVSGSNQPLINGIANWAQAKGKGNSIVFLGADTNTNDRRSDVFNTKPLTTIADELKKWPATVGTTTYIDVIASYDHDGRVKAKSYNVLDDKEFFLNSDHYLLDAVYEITERAPAKKAAPK